MDGLAESLSSVSLGSLTSPIKQPDDTSPIFRGTGITYDEKMGMYDCPWDEHYAEKSSRFNESIKKCKENGLLDRCTKIKSRKATEEELLLQHTPEHIAFLSCVDEITDQEKLEEISSRFDSIRFSQNFHDAALLCVGSLIELVDHIHENKVSNGMAIIRPPGHHASPSASYGYCYYNNVAIAAKCLLKKGLERILIVDWDIHHGNGTQEMFYDNPKVLYFSIHKYIYGEFWPHKRESDADYIGDGNGRGFNVNVPLNQEGLGNEDYLAIFHHILLPIAYEFSPQFVLVSSGYDASIGDFKGGMLLSPPFYSHMVSSLMGLSGGQMCVALEGGYFVPSLVESVSLTLRTLLGDPCPNIGEMAQPKKKTTETIWEVINLQRDYWKCFSHLPIAVHDKQDVNHEKRKRIFRGVKVAPLRFPTKDEDETDPEMASQVHIIMQNTRLTFPKTRTCLIYDQRMTNHFNTIDRAHPEKPDRIRRIVAMHRQMGLINRCKILKSRQATDSELQLVHSAHHLKFMKSLKNLKPKEVPLLVHDFNSVYLCQSSDFAARLAAGCLLEVVDDVLSLKSRNGVAIIRPPGHHAEVDHPMGFCLYNSVAIAAQYAINKYKLSRVLILDWDVHHGNGTQHIFESDPQVLYMSLHRYDNGSFFPLSTDGNYDVVGKDDGQGFTVNIPWNKPGVGDSDYLSAFFHVILPIAYQFNPELVIISAGFDAAINDPLGGCKVTPAGYAHMTHLMSSLAEGKLIVALEGGYNLTSISQSMCCCTKVLLGDPCPPLSTKVVPSSNAMKSILNSWDCQSNYWSRLKNYGNLDPDDISLSSLSTIPSSGQSSSSESSQCNDEEIDRELFSMTACSDEPSQACSLEKTEMFVFSNEAELNDDLPYCVMPLDWCPHLDIHVRSLPSQDFDIYMPCTDCNSQSENWICLFCYKVFCGRYVNQHMVEHSSHHEHRVTLSFSDLSVWCYGCESYVNNEVLYPTKNFFHEKKFGSSMPKAH